MRRCGGKLSLEQVWANVVIRKIKIDPIEDGVQGWRIEDLEIRRAVKALREGQDAPEDDDSEGWIRACLQWLNKA